MSAVVSKEPIVGEPRRKVWTREEVHALQDSGFFEGHRYELIEGELIDKMGQNPPHSNAIMRAQRLLQKMYAIERIRIQLPIEVCVADRGRSEPEPDVAVTDGSADDYAQRHPTGEELALLLEISDSTARMDRLTKLRLYARAGVRDYWVVDIQKRKIYTYRNPQGDTYLDALQFAEDQTVAPLDRPESPILVADLLPKIAG